MKVKPFKYYFSERELLKILSRKRAILAKKEHDKLFHKRLLSDKKVRQFDQILFEIFPSRNSWIRLNKLERKGKNAVEINARQIERTVLRSTNKFKNKPTTDWEIKLYELINSIQSNVFGTVYKIPNPQIYPHFKEEKKGVKIYRPIASFEYIDRIIISQLNKYLTHCFDPLFLDCSYAFRSKVVLGKSFSHHKAVEDIIEYKKKHYDKDIWVAECDIKKFFDCVNHETVIDVYMSKINEVKSTGLIVDERATELFLSYLSCYSFNKDVLSHKLGKNSEFGWVTSDEFEAVGTDVLKAKIGVPQGGAISCLIANLLMDLVDREVMKHDDGQIFYARFCDDMVLIHPNKDICQDSLLSYSEGLKKVKLLNHDFTEITEYSNKFWNSKSKAPYKWGSNFKTEKSKANVPWLSFVGYQISNNLKVRVRKSSIKNEIIKQIKETDKVISLIKKGKKFRVSEIAIKHRLRQRLLAMSVGRKNIFDINKIGQMCWTSGFRVLKENNFVDFQIKNLDRKRGAQISRLTNHIMKMKPDKRPDKNIKIKEFKKEPKYYGSPFSYFFQIK